MGYVLRFLLGLLAGIAVGGSVALLLAPRSGDDSQRWLRERLEQAKEAGRLAAAAREAELRGRWRTLAGLTETE